MHFWSCCVVLTIAWGLLCTGHLIGEPPPVGNRYPDDLFLNGRDVRVAPLRLVEVETLDKDGLQYESIQYRDPDNLVFEEDIETKGISLSIGNEQYSLRWPPSEEFLEEFPFSEIFHFGSLMSHMSDVSKRPNEDISQERRGTIWSLILSIIGRYYLPDRKLVEEVSEQCRSDLDIMFNPNNQTQDSNVTAMIDSWGKMPDGFIAGNIKSLGSFDECIRVLTPRNPPLEGNYFKGKYCTIQYSSNESSESSKDELMRDRPVRLAPASALEPDLQSLVIYGTCMPSSCTEEDLRISLNKHLADRNTSTDVSCQTEGSPEIEFNAAFIMMTVLLSILGFLLLLSSIIDVYIVYSGKDEIRKGPLKYLLVFSVYTNLEKMFQVNLTENKEAITCIYGMRVLSMTWVVWGHQYTIAFANAGNLALLPSMMNGHWLNQVILNAFPSVDTFFFISGLLVAYGILREKARTGKINIIVLYIHRIVRLDVPILLLGGFMATFPKYMVHGPYARTVEDGPYGLQYICRNFWWRDAVFISNYVDTLEPKACLGVTWYTSAELQIFLFTPIMMFPFLWGDLLKLDKRKRNKIGYMWLSILTLFSALIPGIIAVVNEIPAHTFGFDTEIMIAFQTKIYNVPWCRASPYLVGLLLGTMFRMDKEQKISLQKWQVVMGWLVAVTTGLAVVLGMYNYTQITPLQRYDGVASFFYNGFSRMAWGMALAWLIFACRYGYGGPVNTFLSHPVWQPISRLTYCMFLIAIPVQLIVFQYDVQYPNYFSHLNMMVETVGVLFISGIGAVVLSLVTEAPVIGLEKLLLRRGK